MSSNAQAAAPAVGRLGEWGWDDGWATGFEPHAARGAVVGRITAHHRGSWRVMTADGERRAIVTGRLHDSADDGELPVVGDWVALSSGDEEPLPIGLVLPRRTAFVRRAAGREARPQVVAANVDVLLVATAFGHDLNPRRIERYVALGHESGAETVVVLTKADLADPADLGDLTNLGDLTDLGDLTNLAADRAVDRLARDLGVTAVAVSALSGHGLDALGPWLVTGRTVALVGSSGVGKSSLLNRLAGGDLMATRAVRADDGRGRHTTTHRELFRLPGGALVLDTPGMREVGLWDAAEGIEAAFTDIAELAERCRFRDCGHEHEPGCAVRDAVRTGRLDERRLRSWRRLGGELAATPTPRDLRQRREAARRFQRTVRHASEESLARKSYRAWEV